MQHWTACQHLAVEILFYLANVGKSSLAAVHSLPLQVRPLAMSMSKISTFPFIGALWADASSQPTEVAAVCPFPPMHIHETSPFTMIP
ncbi:hypothetical protein COCNU_11G013430 [Cocos nucifera]|uniref:Uncharacterized protein n=1 Tax=Cocos nucifera TaxID=13894 RepID=A0A8K0IQH6_COCNU|nr:hypothetical protein COCNU_11G013430 [Cocos nucifera]